MRMAPDSYSGGPTTGEVGSNAPDGWFILVSQLVNFTVRPILNPFLSRTKYLQVEVHMHSDGEELGIWTLGPEYLSSIATSRTHVHSGHSAPSKNWHSNRYASIPDIFLVFNHEKKFEADSRRSPKASTKSLLERRHKN